MRIFSAYIGACAGIENEFPTHGELFVSQKIYINEAQIIRQAAGTEDIKIYLIDRVPNFKKFENSQPSAKDLLKNLDALVGVSESKIFFLIQSEVSPHSL